MTKKTSKKSSAKSWLDQALAAEGPEEMKKLLDRAEIKVLSERSIRKLRPRFVKPGSKDEAAVDGDALVETLIYACAHESGVRCIPEGRESEVADLPSMIFQRLGNRALSANGYTGEASGN